MTNISKILLQRNYLNIPEIFSENNLNQQELLTVINNFAYYGYLLSKDTLEKITKSDKKIITMFLDETFQYLSEITYDNRDMSSHVVYKNFPKEVINMNSDIYFIKQILIYLGVDSNLLSENKEERLTIEDEIKKLKVLSLPKESTIQNIFTDLVSMNSKWSEEQLETTLFLHNHFKLDFDLKNFNFKLNGLTIGLIFFKDNKSINIPDATDILRLAAMLCEEDPKSKNLKFKNFSRPDRKKFLQLLEESKNLENDVSLNQKNWKRFFMLLHPNDYKKFERVKNVYHSLYNKELKSFNSKIQTMLKNHDENIFSLLKTRSGVFSNMLFNLYSIYGFKAFVNFCDSENIKHVENKKLLKLKVLTKHINDNKKTIYSAPMKKIIFVDFENIFNHKKDAVDFSFTDKLSALKEKFQSPPTDIIETKESKNFLIKNKFFVLEEHKEYLINAINSELKKRLLDTDFIGKSVFVDEKTKLIKLKDNDSSLNNFGAGTVFEIPDNINFIRTASFWTKHSASHYWIDNSFNFINEAFKPVGSCCWNSDFFRNTYSCSSHHALIKSAAVFSGDPVINHEKPSACQMIDINIELLLKSGVRYAVWSALSYNKVPFSSFDDAVLNLQFCEEPQSGELYEPSRSQISFYLANQKVKDKVNCVIDLLERKIIFTDTSLNNLTLTTATFNGDRIAKFLEYGLHNIINKPSLYDLLEVLHDDESESKILYSDKNIKLNTDFKHYVFFKENQENDVDLFNLEFFNK